MPFSSLPSAIAQALAERGYAEATPVQAEVLKSEANDRDLLVSAQTGSGKTVAYGLALATKLLADAERLGPAREPLALVIAPTLELALQEIGKASCRQRVCQDVYTTEVARNQKNKTTKQ